MGSAIRHPRSATRHRQRGFTLIEAALTTVIVGTGVLAIVAAQQAYHAKNGWAVRTGTAMLLANEIRELTWYMPVRDPQDPTSVGVEANEYTNGEPDVKLFDDLDDFAGPAGGDLDGVTFSPPINALGLEIPDTQGWSQKVRVEGVQPIEINGAGGTYAVGTTAMVRMTVDVYYTDPNTGVSEIATTLSWVVPE